MTDLLPISLIDWLVASALILLVLILAIALLRRLFRRSPKQPYQLKPLFGPEEAKALKLLEGAVGRELRIFPAVRLTDVLAVSPKLKKAHQEQAWHRIYGERLDFVLCSPRELKVRLAIALIDDSLSKTERRNHHSLLQAVVDAGLPLVHLSAKAWPSEEELREEIHMALKQPAAPEPVMHAGKGRIEPTLSLPAEPELQDRQDRNHRL